MNKIDYIFYRIYRFQISVGNNDPIGSTVIGMAGVLMFNLFSFMLFLYPLTNYFILFFNSSALTVITLFSIILIFVIFRFTYKKRYKRIIEFYKNEDKSEVRKGNIYVLIYLVFTILLIYLSGYLMYKKNGG